MLKFIIRVLDRAKAFHLGRFKCIILSPVIHSRVYVIGNLFSRYFNSPVIVITCSRFIRISVSSEINVLTIGLPVVLHSLFLSSLNPDILVLRAHWNQKVILDIVQNLRINTKKCHICYDTIDVIANALTISYKELYREQVHAEFALISLSSFVLARDARINLLKDKIHTLRNKSIVFLPEVFPSCSIYSNPIKACDNFSFSPIELVYVGNISMDPSCNNSWQFSLAEIIRREDITLNIYNSFNSNHLKLIEYIENNDLVGTIVSHAPIPFHELASTISRHHIGLTVSRLNSSKPHSTYIERAVRLTLGAKTFDYQQSSLPVICERGLFVSRLVTSKHIGLAVDDLAEIPNAAKKIVSDYRNFVNPQSLTAEEFYPYFRHSLSLALNK